MSAVSFDTLEYCQMLQEAGVPREQAEAFARANAKAFTSMVTTQQLATKQDIESVKREAEANKHEILKWMVTAMTAQTVLLIGIIAF